jgi:hypothetical protein
MINLNRYYRLISKLAHMDSISWKLPYSLNALVLSVDILENCDFSQINNLELLIIHQSGREGVKCVPLEKLNIKSTTANHFKFITLMKESELG